jgi:hypothetical protein
MRTRGWELVTTNEPSVLAKPFLDAFVVEDGQSDRRLPDPPCTDESDGCEAFGETNDLLDQLVASETGPRPRGRRLSRYARYKCKVLNSWVVEATDLVWAG